MKSKTAPIVDALEELADIYIHAEEIDPTLPIQTYLQRTINVIKESRESELPDISTWIEQMETVAADVPTGELHYVFVQITNQPDILNQYPDSKLIIITLSAVLIECRNDIPGTPIGSVTDQLANAISENPPDSDILESACRATIDIARSTAVTKLTLDRIKNIEFIHPSESKTTVSQQVLTAHQNQNKERLQSLAFAVDQSDRGSWEQPDLRNYTDDSNSGIPFENLIADLWSQMGYETSLTVGGSDGGVDIIGTNDSEEILIQAKRYDSKRVEGPEIRKLAGLFPQYDFDRAILVTSSELTDPAEEEAARVADLEVITGSELAKMLSDSGLHPPVALDSQS